MRGLINLIDEREAKHGYIAYLLASTLPSGRTELQ